LALLLLGESAILLGYQFITDFRNKVFTMKVMSAVIIVVTGAALVAVGAFATVPDSSKVLTLSGWVLGVVGLIGWITQIACNKST
jgi:predicted tellurium resistance membrane protein TerC